MIHQNLSTLRKLMLLKGATGGSKAIEATATGNPLTFVTDLARPLKSLLIPFSPRQDGSGDPSPQNIRSILPWNGLSVWQAGSNLADFEIIQGGIEGATGAENTSPNRVKTKDAFFIKGNGTKYTIDAGGVGAVWVYNYNLDGSYSESQDQGFKSLPYTYTRNGGDCLLKLAFRVTTAEEIAVSPSDISNVRFQVGTTLSPFETADVSEHKAVFPSAVYGGTLDVVSGVLKVEWAGFSATWGDGESATDIGEGIIRKAFPMVDYLTTGIANNMCNIAPYQASENATVHFYYSGSGATNRKARLFLPSDTPDTTVVTVITKLSQTYEIQLTPAQLTALVGNNTIWSDADGQMTAVYLKKG